MCAKPAVCSSADGLCMCTGCIICAGAGQMKKTGHCYPTEVEEFCSDTVMVLFSEVLVFIRDRSSALYEILEKN